MFRHNCRVIEALLGVIILVFAVTDIPYGEWVMVVAAVILILHGSTCTVCGVSIPSEFLKPKRRR